MTWVLLLITYAEDGQAYVPFRDAATCGNALPVIHNSITQEWPDAIVQCVVTDVPKIRPRARPEVSS